MNRDQAWGGGTQGFSHPCVVSGSRGQLWGHLGSPWFIYDHQGLGAWVVRLVSAIKTSSPTIPKAWDLFLLPHSGKRE